MSRSTAALTTLVSNVLTAFVSAGCETLQFPAALVKLSVFAAARTYLI